MLSRTHNIIGVCILEYVEEAQVLCSVQDAVDVIGEAGHRMQAW